MAKELLELGWVEDFLPKDMIRKRMFGGFAYYLNEKLMLLMFESPGSKSYHGVIYDFEIWQGCMFPVEKESQESVLAQYPFLVNHPILPKWLYLPMETENFESYAEEILRELRRQDPRFGTIPDRKKSKKLKTEKVEKIGKMDTRKPRMFSDEPAEEKFKKAKHLTDLKNFGPSTEKIFLKAGIKTPDAFVKLGWKKAMEKICRVDPKYNHSLFAYAVIGALSNTMWNGIPEEAKLEAREFMKSLRAKGSAKKKSQSSVTKKTVKKKVVQQKISPKKARPSKRT